MQDKYNCFKIKIDTQVKKSKKTKKNKKNIRPIRSKAKKVLSGGEFESYDMLASLS